MKNTDHILKFLIQSGIMLDTNSVKQKNHLLFVIRIVLKQHNSE
jgi:hypothetical protein